LAKKKVKQAPVVAKRKEVELDHPIIPVTRQCALLGLSRSSFYYRPCGENEFNLMLMRMIDEKFTERPFYGARRMRAWLRRCGFKVNRKRISRLMRLMGLEAIYPKPRLSAANPEHKIFPYLLKGVHINQSDQAWCADITYIRLLRGFVYLAVVMDWFSRYVLSWEVSITLEKTFCMEALEKALLISKPEIFNTDQGSQFTSEAFTGLLLDNGIRISMDGRGRLYDNIFVERLWRTVKYEEVYLHEYRTIAEAQAQLDRYFRFYNQERPHAALGYRTPYEVYFGTSAMQIPGRV
jgi:putative transposase